MSRISGESNFNGILTDLYFTIYLEYGNLNNFLELSTTLSEKEMVGIEKKIDKWNTDNPGHEYSGHDVYESDFYKLLSYEKEINYAILLLAYAKFEATLNRICIIIGKEKNFNIQVQDITGKGIHRSRKYLEKMFLLDFSGLNTEWELIKNYSELRNTIVHSYGEISVPDGKRVEDTDPIKKFKRIIGFDTTGDNFITITKETIKEFIGVTDKFLNNILDLLKENP